MDKSIWMTILEKSKYSIKYIYIYINIYINSIKEIWLREQGIWDWLYNKLSISDVCIQDK